MIHERIVAIEPRPGRVVVVRELSDKRLCQFEMLPHDAVKLAAELREAALEAEAMLHDRKAGLG